MHDDSPSCIEAFFGGMVRYTRWLAKIPGFALLADTLSRVLVALFDSRRHRALLALEQEILAWPEVTTALHSFGGVEFRRHDRELGHFHGCGLLDVHLDPDRARAAVAAGRAELHHVLGASAWVSRWVRSAEDVPGALALLREAWRAAGEHGSGDQASL
jgi:hypothetical protein